MATVLFANNAQTTLAGAITSTALTANLSPGSGVLFPSPSSGQYFVMTFVDAATGLTNEIVHVTNVTSDTITMVRGQEGTTAKAWSSGDIAANFNTAGTQAAFAQIADMQNSKYIYSADTGSGGNYVLTISPTPVATNVAGTVYCFKANSASTGSASTITINGNAYSLTRMDGGVPFLNQIKVNSFVFVEYDPISGGFMIASVTNSATVVQQDSATGSAYLPSGSTSQRTASPVAGCFRYNSTTGNYEGYYPNTTSWNQIGGNVSSTLSRLVIDYDGTTGITTVTANSVPLQNTSGGGLVLTGVNLTATPGAMGANGLDTGSWAYSTVYNLFVIYNATSSTSALLWSLSNTTPTLPSGYTYYTRIGANFSQSATNYYMLGGIQRHNTFQYRVATGSNVTQLPLMASGAQGAYSTSTYTPVAVAVSTFIPQATAAKIFISLSTYASGAFAGASPNANFSGYGLANQPPFGSNGTETPSPSTGFMIIESSNIYYASNASQAALACFGWEDNL